MFLSIIHCKSVFVTKIFWNKKCRIKTAYSNCIDGAQFITRLQMYIYFYLQDISERCKQFLAGATREKIFKKVRIKSHLLLHDFGVAGKFTSFTQKFVFGRLLPYQKRPHISQLARRQCRCVCRLLLPLHHFLPFHRLYEAICLAFHLKRQYVSWCKHLLDHSPITGNGLWIMPSSTVRLLEAHLDETMYFETHVSKIISA